MSKQLKVLPGFYVNCITISITYTGKVPRYTRYMMVHTCMKCIQSLCMYTMYIPLLPAVYSLLLQCAPYDKSVLFSRHIKTPYYNNVYCLVCMVLTRMSLLGKVLTGSSITPWLKNSLYQKNINCTYMFTCNTRYIYIYIYIYTRTRGGSIVTNRHIEMYLSYVYCSCHVRITHKTHNDKRVHPV